VRHTWLLLASAQTAVQLCGRHPSARMAARDGLRRLASALGRRTQAAWLPRLPHGLQVAADFPPASRCGALLRQPSWLLCPPAESIKSVGARTGQSAKEMGCIGCGLPLALW